MIITLGKETPSLRPHLANPGGATGAWFLQREACWISSKHPKRKSQNFGVTWMQHSSILHQPLPPARQTCNKCIIAYRWHFSSWLPLFANKPALFFTPCQLCITTCVVSHLHSDSTLTYLYPHKQLPALPQAAAGCTQTAQLSCSSSHTLDTGSACLQHPAAAQRQSMTHTAGHGAAPSSAGPTQPRCSSRALAGRQ